MAITAKMVASEILVCGVKYGLKFVPGGEVAVNVIEGLQKRHETLSNAQMLARFESQLSRVERGMRDTVEKEIRTILANLGRPSIPGPELTREMTELRQIYEQGWQPNLFEGLLRNSTHWEELKRNPRAYGRILGDHDPVDPENGMHLLIDKDKTRILELPASSLAFLLGNQIRGVPGADVRAVQDIWAFASKEGFHGNEIVYSTLDSNERKEPTETMKLFVGEWRALSNAAGVQSLVINEDRTWSVNMRLILSRPDAGAKLSGIWKIDERRLFLRIESSEVYDPAIEGTVCITGDWHIDLPLETDSGITLTLFCDSFTSSTGYYKNPTGKSIEIVKAIWS
jgi:hypothetical protein